MLPSRKFSIMDPALFMSWWRSAFNDVNHWTPLAFEANSVTSLNWHVLQILAHLFDLKRRAWNNLQLHLSLSHYMSSKKNQLLLSLIFFLSSKYLLSTQCNSNSSHQNNVKMIPKHENNVSSKTSSMKLGSKNDVPYVLT